MISKSLNFTFSVTVRPRDPMSVSGLTAFRSVDAADPHADLTGLGFHREGVAVSD
jgi:hypothetical protein